jgi:hypothetical protein
MVVWIMVDKYEEDSVPSSRDLGQEDRLDGKMLPSKFVLSKTCEADKEEELDDDDDDDVLLLEGDNISSKLGGSDDTDDMEQ